MPDGHQVGGNCAVTSFVGSSADLGTDEHNKKRHNLVRILILLMYGALVFLGGAVVIL